MDWTHILETVVLILVSMLSYYLYLKSTVVKNAEQAIADAEQTEKIGEEKKQLAVNQVISLIPVGARIFFPRFVVEKIIQQIFDRIEKFAKKK